MIHKINIENNKELSLLDILEHFQTAAVEHGNLLGLSHQEMLKSDMFWVLLRTKFVIDINPKDKIEVITYPKQPVRLDYDREYVIKSNNNSCIKGVSKWLVASFSTRKLVRNANIVFPGNYIEEVNFDSFDKIRFDNDKMNFIDKYVVVEQDLDKNGHVNNTRYAVMIDKIYNSSNIKEFQIDYINEVFINNVVNLYMYKDEHVYILGECNDKKCFIAKIKEKE